MEFYRQSLQRTGTETVTLPGAASALSAQNNAAAILEATGSQIIPRGSATAAPETQVLQVLTNDPATAVQPVANQALVNPAPGLGAGLMAWVKENPMVAAGVAVGAIWLLSELTKGGKK